MDVVRAILPRLSCRPPKRETCARRSRRGISKRGTGEDESGENVSYCYTWKWDKEEAQISEYMRGHYGEGVEVELYDIEGYEPRKPIYHKRGEEVAA